MNFQYGTDYESLVTRQEDQLHKMTGMLNKAYNFETEREYELNQIKINNINTQLNIKLAKLHGSEKAEKESEVRLLEAKLNNINTLFTEQAEYTNRFAAQRLETEKQINSKLVALGLGAVKQKYDAEMEAYNEQLEAAQRSGDKAAIKEAKRKKKEKEKELAENDKDFKKLIKRKNAFEIQSNNAKNKELAKQDIQDGLFGKGKTFQERLDGLKNAFKGENGKTDVGKGISELVNALSSMTEALDSQIDEITSKKSSIDTRLQGSGNYWDDISKDITSAAAISPLVKQADIAKSVEDMVSKGIAYNVEQRAFLNVIKNKIATTFDAADGTLLRLIRIQQQDSTAGRLGMESALNSFLNEMYQTSEYLSDLASSVRGSLAEAEALMAASDAMSLEYQIQKWVGSLYSVGMSSNAVTNISNAIGQIASGDISGLTGTGTGNLMIMAANRADLSISEILTKGLDDSSANQLLQAMVNYMAEMYNDAQDSKVVQQQIAQVFGVAASDLKAAVNLSSSVSSVSEQSLAYTDAINQLQDMADSMYSRTSMGEILNNVWDNFTYSISAGIADNPVLYGIYKTAGLLDTTLGGLPLPFLNVFGSGIDLNTSVADLMRVGALSGSLLTGVAQVITGSGNGGLTGKGLLSAFGISGTLSSVSRGTKSASGSSTSESGSLVANGDASSVKDKTLSDANKDSKKQLATAQEEEDNDISNKIINENIIKIYELLNSVSTGSASMTVVVKDYGLVGWN